MAHNFIQIIFTYNAIKYLSNLKLHKVSQRDTHSFISKSYEIICRSFETTLGSRRVKDVIGIE